MGCCENRPDPARPSLITLLPGATGTSAHPAAARMICASRARPCTGPATVVTPRTRSQGRRSASARANASSISSPMSVSISTDWVDSCHMPLTLIC
jgi:hypothetical protein